jgi:hypothetical protein
VEEKWVICDRAIISTKSVFFEKLIEHRFIADIMMYGWYSYKKEVKILRCEIDSSGYDLLIDCEDTYRYIQLRTSAFNSKRSYQKINISFIKKQNPCIIWILYEYNNAKNDLEFKYFFWGSDVGKRTPSITRYVTARKKTNAHGVKKIIPHLKNIPKGHFKEIKFYDLFGKLFDLKRPAKKQSLKKQCR